MGFNEKMTTLADAIRELSDTTTDKTLDNMSSDLDTANAEIAEQTELIGQIATALEGKAAGGGGGSSNSGDWISVASLPSTLAADPEASSRFTSYYEIPENCCAVILRNQLTGECIISYANNDSIRWSGASNYSSGSERYIELSDADDTGTILRVVVGTPTTTYILPIYGNSN